MKKLGLIMLMFLFLLGCSSEPKEVTSETPNNEPVGTNDEEETEVVEEEEETSEPTGSNGLGHPVTVDGVTITLVDVHFSEVVGDRTEDNFAEENGEYFANGSDILKASDYEWIDISVKVENNSGQAINFSEMGWIAKLPDGYKLNDITATGKLKEQIPSNYTAEEKVSILKEKAIKADSMVVTYNFLDYNEEWNQAIWGAIQGTVTEEEFNEKFTIQEIDFEIQLNN